MSAVSFASFAVQDWASGALAGIARQEGYRSLREDGLIKAWRGMTSIDEVLHVTRIAEDEE